MNGQPIITADLEVMPQKAPFEEPRNQVVKMQDISSLWNTFVAMRGELAPNTAKDYRWMGKRFCNFAANRSIGPGLLKDWMGFLTNITFRRGGTERKISAVKVNWINSRIKAFLYWLHKFGYLSRDYRDCVPKLMEDIARAAEIIEEGEYQIIKNYCAGRMATGAVA